MINFPTIILKAIPHNKHRYETCGDYFKKNGKWYILCSKMRIEFVFLVLIHEFVEWFLTQMRGIKEKDITAFDIMFEKERDNGKCKDEEPGDDVRAPYWKEHQFATKIDKLCCEELGLNYNQFEQTVLDLFK